MLQLKLKYDIIETQQNRIQFNIFLTLFNRISFFCVFVIRNIYCYWKKRTFPVDCVRCFDIYTYSILLQRDSAFFVRRSFDFCAFFNAEKTKEKGCKHMQIELKIFADDDNLGEQLIANHIDKLLISDSIELERKLSDLMKFGATAILREVQEIIKDISIPDDKKLNKIVNILQRNSINCGLCCDD